MFSERHLPQRKDIPLLFVFSSHICNIPASCLALVLRGLEGTLVLDPQGDHTT